MGRYVDTSELLIGDMPVSPVRATMAVTAAEDAIDARLGLVYALPLALGDPATAANIKTCARFLASGIYMLDVPAAGEDSQVNALGAYFMREGQERLAAMADGSINLFGETRRTETVSAGNAPSIVGIDATSGVDAFYAWSMNYNTGTWTPG